jgi:hypothetical protein
MARRATIYLINASDQLGRTRLLAECHHAVATQLLSHLQIGSARRRRRELSGLFRLAGRATQTLGSSGKAERVSQSNRFFPAAGTG